MLRQISHSLYIQILPQDDVIGSVITRCALQTVSYYMLEFRDEVNEKWMMGFNNYKTKGFTDGSWTNYIEKMIVMDKLQVEVLMKATSASLRSRRIPEGSNVVMQYFHELGKLSGASWNSNLLDIK